MGCMPLRVWGGYHTRGGVNLHFTPAPPAFPTAHDRDNQNVEVLVVGCFHLDKALIPQIIKSP